ncbi:hypothetical protein [Clostridium chauvoei]|uniref:Uncharacterized protein n=2 Tax=Clostridium chauvoei TaxID=46867 RepID=S6ERJ4_9CLOT|nr:hypothetical protein [Clostridium chauvoei]ATD55159.1 hypothetical protein BTM20_07855 [Clostridium chauvoei]ATD57168.1 hypothetical protein BTM21_05195 [Clostridium chauvoei]MBX7279498.1 hypothetical protein [Clostridium chauvoei]MBX7281867.1 hypothetical protein [Clostridium chauvoei]MBX7284544.1 hypothetical protein [Clostridium chauvoei]
MDIEKGKIVEVSDKKNNVTKYIQVIKNKNINELKEIEAESLNALMSKVRGQIIEWESNYKILR